MRLDCPRVRSSALWKCRISTSFNDAARAHDRNRVVTRQNGHRKRRSTTGIRCPTVSCTVLPPMKVDIIYKNLYPHQNLRTDAHRRTTMQITDLIVTDVRFPTSQNLDGSDAMNPDPDYSAAYVILKTDDPRFEGHGLTFTIGRGNEICCAAIEALAPLVVGLTLEWIKENGARFWRHLTGDSQLRWI